MSDMEQRVSEQAYLHTSQAGAWVPLQQAGISGLLAGAFVMAICLKLNVQDGWFYALIGCMGVTIVMWTVLQFHWFNLTALEKFTGLDLDGDKEVGEPQQPVVNTVRVNIHEVSEDGYPRMQTANFPVSPEDLTKLARGLLAGRPFSEGEWCGDGKPFSKKQFKAMRTEMLQRKLIKLRNPKPGGGSQGFILTKSGEATMKRLVELAQGQPSPTPPEDEA